MTNKPHNGKAKDEIMAFPCTFPIKVMGLHDADLENFVKDVLKKHCKDKKTIKIESRQSRHNNYISVTATFTANSREELDVIYQEITKNPAVKFTL